MSKRSITPYIDAELEKKKPQLPSTVLNGKEVLLHHGDGRRLALVVPDENEAFEIAGEKEAAAARGDDVEYMGRDGQGIMRFSYTKKKVAT